MAQAAGRDPVHVGSIPTVHPNALVVKRTITPGYDPGVASSSLAGSSIDRAVWDRAGLQNLPAKFDSWARCQPAMALYCRARLPNQE